LATVLTNQIHNHQKPKQQKRTAVTPFQSPLTTSDEETDPVYSEYKKLPKLAQGNYNILYSKLQSLLLSNTTTTLGLDF